MCVYVISAEGTLKDSYRQQDVMKLPRANISDYKSTQKVSESHTSVFSLFAG